MRRFELNHSWRREGGGSAIVREIPAGNSAVKSEFGPSRREGRENGVYGEAPQPGVVLRHTWFLFWVLWECGKSPLLLAGEG